MEPHSRIGMVTGGLGNAVDVFHAPSPDVTATQRRAGLAAFIEKEADGPADR